jgi:hypothetical protein
MATQRRLAKTAARGYGSKHQRLRAQYQRRMDQGERFNCWRCGLQVDPNHWDLGHDDTDRSIIRGPEHVGRECPQGGNRGVAKRKAAGQPRRWDL